MDHRIHQIPSQQALQFPITAKSKTSDQGLSFKSILKEQQELKVSKHASDRLQERNIHLNDTQWKIINEKVTEARAKGVTDSLVVMNNTALLVSAKNNTVVTAMSLDEASNRIFTNINGTILIND
ncbi:flagellar protein [Ornithinibacillus sp. BX22]|uniref:Flagellar protein n=2 Tax=Ornithinibacillus TaxID=484508 RepID=A0A923L3W7_9BACI|nr:MULTISPECIES: TIGR02530 family flagellar biosynthesis protein [Ornithinibacillus]MBC5635966.1 flagellar protein [Ornithinibacillus hominis]MBS3680045.1 flagellar protein [Ornithinibacillus massiliensis]